MPPRLGWVLQDMELEATRAGPARVGGKTQDLHDRARRGMSIGTVSMEPLGAHADACATRMPRFTPHPLSVDRKYKMRPIDDARQSMLNCALRESLLVD